MSDRHSAIGRCRCSRSIAAPSSPIRGFTDSLRSEIIHDKLNIHIDDGRPAGGQYAAVRLGAEQDGRARQSRLRRFTSRRSPARAIFFAATHHRRDIWVGFPTVKAILANRVAPGLIDRYLAKAGYSGQLTRRAPADGRAGQSVRARARRLRRTWPVRQSSQGCAVGKCSPTGTAPPSGRRSRTCVAGCVHLLAKKAQV